MADFDIEGARKAGYTEQEIQQFLAQRATPKVANPGQQIWQGATYPMRKVAELGGKMDVAAGLKTPEEAAANVEPYGDMGTQVLATGLGGIGAGALKAGRMAPALGRILTQGGINALKANEGERGSEFIKGAESAAVGESTGALMGRILSPFKGLKSLIPSMGPRAGEKWVKDYTYGTIPGRSEPALVRDVLENVTKPKPASAVGIAGQSAYDQSLDKLRQMLGL